MMTNLHPCQRPGCGGSLIDTDEDGLLRCTLCARPASAVATLPLVQGHAEWAPARSRQALEVAS